MKARIELQTILKEICDELRIAGDSDYRSQIQRLVPGVQTHGVRVPVIRTLVACFAKRFSTLSFVDCCVLLDHLSSEGNRDEFLFGICWLARFSKSFDHLPWPRICNWMKAIDNWEVCDQLAMQIAGPCVAKRLALIDELVALTAHENCWHRRFAVASTVPLNPKGRSFAGETFRVLLPVIADKDPSVRKAVTWAIREVCKNDEAAAFRFLSEQSSKMSLSMLRESAQKLTSLSRASLGLT